MSLIIDGNTIPNTGDVYYNGTKLTKVVCNGITVWEKIVFTTKEFGYTGGVQSVTLPPGLYKLEVWGAQGNNIMTAGKLGRGGYGGYSCGYRYFSTEITLYVICGQYGNNIHNYNGGTCGGGGATHISFQADIIKNSAISNILLIAGGGGAAGAGGDHYMGADVAYIYNRGGAGGGTNGGNGSQDHYSSGLESHSYGTGGTQSSGGIVLMSGTEIVGKYYPLDQYPNYVSENQGVIPGLNYGRGSYGEGGYSWVYSLYSTPGTSGGGGGGYYGGGGGGNCNRIAPGGGGSGYIGGVPTIVHNGISYSPSMANDQKTEHGAAKITYITS